MSQPLPLAGVRIVAVEQYGAGPWGTLYCADLGAEVIKVENPAEGGEVGRAVGPHFFGPGDSHFFQTYNRNKKSIALDLKQPDGQRVLHDLVRTADGVSDNLRGDLPGKLGLTYDALKHINPKIVCAHLSAYGREGARTTGQGRDLDVSLFDLALHNLNYTGTWYLNAGEVTGRAPRGGHPSLTPSQLYRTADGWLFIMCNKEKFWRVLAAMLGKPEWADDPGFATYQKRLANRDRLTRMLDAALMTHDTAHWLKKFAGKVPVAPVHDIAQALDSAFVHEREAIREFAYADGRRARMIANPIRVPGAALPARAAPGFGADTDALLAEMHYDAARIAELKRKHVVK